jgi:dihydropteroate synthase
MLMGIVNVNDDSFSGDGTLDLDEAAKISHRQICAGADIVDVGAESAGTRRAAISIEQEIVRLNGYLERWPEIVAKASPRDSQQIWPPILSINTWRPEVTEVILASADVEFLNDMGGLPDARNAELCAAAAVSLLIMHTVAEPKVPQTHRQWEDIMSELSRFFSAKIAVATAAGLRRESIVIDPGIDFAKQRQDNLTILRELGRLCDFGVPILVPLSRKKVIGEVLGRADPQDRDAGTIACIVSAVQRGASILRIHQVDAAWQAVRMMAALRDSGP